MSRHPRGRAEGLERAKTGNRPGLVFIQQRSASHPGQLGSNWSVLFENLINRWLGKNALLLPMRRGEETNASQRGAEEQEGRFASRQLVEERLCLFQVRGFEPLGEPAVNWREDIDGLVAFVVFGHYSGQRCGGTEFEKSSPARRAVSRALARHFSTTSVGAPSHCSNKASSRPISAAR